MKRSSVLIVGCGDLGIRTGALLLKRGWSVAGVRRNPAQLPAEFNRYGADYTESGSLDFAAALKPDYVLATFNPPDRSTTGYIKGFRTAASNLLAGLGEMRVRVGLFLY